VSFANFSAVCRELTDENEVAIVCAGTDGHVTREDTLLAGAIVADLAREKSCPLNDQALGVHERLYGAEVMTLFRGVKEAFDPLTILNPGVILPARGDDPVRHLKVGADAAPIPDDIAAALRTIERTGGYATPRLSLATP